MDTEIALLLENCRLTNFPGFFEFKSVQIGKSKPFIFVFTGPTGSGKSTFVKFLSKKYPKVKTATTRTERRFDEDENSFIWIKEDRFDGESLEDFQTRLEYKYKLLESNYHAGNLYGTPKDELEKVLKSESAIISTENNGAKALLKDFSSQANIIVFFVLPDSFEQLKKRAESTRNDFEERLKIAKQEIESSKEITNFYIHNTENNIYSHEKNPLEFTLENLNKFLLNLRK